MRGQSFRSTQYVIDTWLFTLLGSILSISGICIWNEKAGEKRLSTLPGMLTYLPVHCLEFHFHFEILSPRLSMSWCWLKNSTKQRIHTMQCLLPEARCPVNRSQFIVQSIAHSRLLSRLLAVDCSQWIARTKGTT